MAQYLPQEAGAFPGWSKNPRLVVYKLNKVFSKPSGILSNWRNPSYLESGEVFPMPTQSQIKSKLERDKKRANEQGQSTERSRVHTQITTRSTQPVTSVPTTPTPLFSLPKISTTSPATPTITQPSPAFGLSAASEIGAPSPRVLEIGAPTPRVFGAPSSGVSAFGSAFGNPFNSFATVTSAGSNGFGSTNQPEALGNLTSNTVQELRRKVRINPNRANSPEFGINSDSEVSRILFHAQSPRDGDAASTHDQGNILSEDTTHSPPVPPPASSEEIEKMKKLREEERISRESSKQESAPAPESILSDADSEFAKGEFTTYDGIPTSLDQINENASPADNGNEMRSRKPPNSKTLDLPRLEGVTPEQRDSIMSSVCWESNIKFANIVGLKLGKQLIEESIIQQLRIPNRYTGLRKPDSGMLLFGPPGNGKSSLAKAIVGEVACTFFSVSAETLTSKWVPMFGDGEKAICALYTIANAAADTTGKPSVIFFDEVDGILAARSSNDHEASRRMRATFLSQIDGVTSSNSRATNCPEDLDKAALRRFKLVYVGLPNASERLELVSKLLKGENNNLSNAELSQVAEMTEHYSADDLTRLCRQAALIPARERTKSFDQ